MARERLANVQRKLSQSNGGAPGLGQDGLELPPTDFDGFIHWLRERNFECIARVVERERAEYGL